MSFPHGAPCTVELKKEARYEFERDNHIDWHILGFHAGEKRRHDRFVLTERSNILPVLINMEIDKRGCASIIKSAGINLPLAYKMGLPNANCLGCVKATSPTYWNKIREVAPAVFHARAEQSRRLGSKLVRVGSDIISGTHACLVFPFQIFIAMSSGPHISML